MKTINLTNRAKDKLLHIEAEGCIVNIRVGLHNQDGQEVTSIEILHDEGWLLDGFVNNRIIQEENHEV